MMNWAGLLEKFNMNLCMPERLTQFLEQWVRYPLPYWGKILWRASIAAVLWNIWLERNNRTFGRSCSTIREIVETAAHSALTWVNSLHGLPPFPIPVIKKFWNKVAQFKAQKPPKMVEWVPPTSSTIKLNFDGSSLGNPGPAGVGGVIRNSNCEILMAYSGPATRCTSNEAEAKALLQGLKLAKQYLDGPIEVEGDSQLVIGWAKKRGSSPWHLKHVFDEVEKITRDWRIAWLSTPRSANSVADALAKAGVEKRTLELGQCVATLAPH